MTSDKHAHPASFVIVTLPRCGSYNLVSLLNSAPDIVCHGEVFKPNAVELADGPLGKLGMKSDDVAPRDAKPMAFLNRLRGLNARKIVGFKMFPEHANRVKALKEHVLRHPKWLKLFLRRNPIESYASLLRARQTGVWTVRTTSPASRRGSLDARVTFTAESFDRHMEFANWFDTLCGDLSAIEGNRCLAVDYEAVADRSALPGILSFIGSTGSAESLTSEYEKQFSGSLAEGFANWDDLVVHARAQGHEGVLQSPG
jgi:LPS sulfotransferase NodH